VPQDISVVGFDDVPLAVFSNPQLTTVRQPLQRMGQIAAKTLIDQIEGKEKFQAEIVIEPALIVRASTGAAPRTSSSGMESALELAGLSYAKAAMRGPAKLRRQRDG
jgi:LacI family transcriptional regulator